MEENKNIENAISRLQNLRTKQKCVGLRKQDYEYIEIAHQTLIAEGIDEIVVNSMIKSILNIEFNGELV